MQEKNYIAIHTHDRMDFRTCRLKWYFASEHGLHLTPKEEANSALWFGTGIHFALEDFHGYRRFSTANHAFQAFYNCFKDYYSGQMPIDHEDLLELGHGILEYYPIWLGQRDIYKTLWIEDVPQIEVDFSIPIPELSEYAGKEVRYEGTLDRVVIDPFGRLWIMDYKTAKQFDTVKLELDAQVSAYAWAAEQHYGRPVEGMIYLQLKKAYPKYPRLTKQGFSVDKNQHTTARLFRQALTEAGYDAGTILPEKYVNYINYLTEQETPEGDRFVRWDLIRRNDIAKDYEYRNIILEGMDMLDPNVRIYPNPRPDCSRICDFRSVHLAMMDGSDWQWILEEGFKKKEEDRRPWLSKIKWEDPSLPLGSLLL